MSAAYNAFISYAGEDRQMAAELTGALKGAGLSVWYAELNLRVGDKLLDSIEQGLNDSTFGILLISPEYLKKGWTNYEMDVLIRQSVEKGKKLLPVWVDVTKEEVEERHAGLAGIVAVRAEDGVPVISKKLIDVISASAPSIGVIPSWESPSHRFLEGHGELNLKTHKGMCTTVWEFLLYARDDMYPLAIAGECFTKRDLLMRVVQILPHVPDRVTHWVGQDGYDRIWQMCVDAGMNPKNWE